jgi:hypothetical protein
MRDVQILKLEDRSLQSATSLPVQVPTVRATSIQVPMYTVLRTQRNRTYDHDSDIWRVWVCATTKMLSRTQKRCPGSSPIHDYSRIHYYGYIIYTNLLVPMRESCHFQFRE